MEELAQSLKVALAESFSFYLKAHKFHWNVEGPDFVQYHEFLANLYTEVWAGVDVIAELIRTLEIYAPGSYTEFKELSTIAEAETISDGLSMLNTLLNDNNSVLVSLLKAYKLAEAAGEIGISNSIQDRITTHQKHGWMLKSLTK
jgi:starvation-inducible DNA-binding protein